MPTYVRRDLEGGAEPCSRARPELIDAPARRGFGAGSSNDDGYSSEELDVHANEQLRSTRVANSNALLARVHQPRQPLRVNRARVVFQPQARGHSAAEPPADARDDDALNEPAEPSTT